MHKSEVCEFYANTNVLLTGGTGFLGKIIIEKLLRSCSNINALYIIIRPKKGLSVQQRLDKLFEDAVFETLKTLQPNFLSKIKCVEGNISDEGLGLSDQDRTLLINEINIVFHSAATVRFTEHLKWAVNTNVRGTRDMLALCDEMKHLKSVMYVSTAYSFCIHERMDEVFYKPPMTPEELIRLADSMDVKALDKITPELIGDWPNTYSFTKAVAEDLVRAKVGSLPIGLYRPSIVAPTYKEPVKMWTDNYNGLTGLSVACGFGILHVVYTKSDVKANIVPVDYCVNGLLAAAPTVAKQRNPNFQYPIFNSVERFKDCRSIGDHVNLMARDSHKNPLSNSVYHVYYIFVSCLYWYQILNLFLHYIPALVIDFLLLCTGQKPKVCKIQRMLHKAQLMLTRFTHNEWDIGNDNMEALWNNLNNVDKQIFPFDMKINWDEFYDDYSYYIKKYLLKDTGDNTKAKIRLNRLKWIHRFILATLSILGFYVIWKVIFDVI